MKKYILLWVFAVIGLVAQAQFAEPAVTGANFIPNSIPLGTQSELRISFANSGSTPIPVNSIELTISTASTYYKTNGTTAPTGTGAAYFTWTYVGSDIWRGTNKTAVPAFDGGDVVLKVTGILVSTTFETTNINVQPVSNFTAFTDAPANNNLQPKLQITPPKAVIYAYDDNNVTNKGVAVSGNVLLNDDKATGTAPLVVSTTPVMQPTNGSVTLNANGSYTYTPNATYIGTDTFKYRVCDSGTPAVCDTALVTINILDPTATNRPPIALSDNANTPVNTAVSGNVLLNDADPDAGQTLTASIVTQPLHGTVSLNPNGTYTYTPANGYVGNDVFTYKACDNGTPQLCTNAIVNINVGSSNTLYPITNADLATRCPTCTATGNVLSNDILPQGSVLSTTPVVQPTNGTVVLNADGTFTYTPNAGYTGADQFTYQVCNGNLCSQAVVFIIPKNTTTGNADLRISKTIVGNKVRNLNETVTYTVVVRNLGPDAATNVVVKDSVGTGLELVSSSPTKGTFAAPLWNIASIASGDSAVLTVTAKVVAEGISFNYAIIKNADQTDPIKTNNDASACVTVPVKLCAGQKVEVSVPTNYTNVVWTKNGQQVAVGNVVMFSDLGTYTFTATNNTCPAGGCCPIVIEAGDNCCPVQLCIPVTVVKRKK